jgi:hypothetical protein
MEMKSMKTRPLVHKINVLHGMLGSIVCGKCHDIIVVEDLKIEETAICPKCCRGYTFKGQIHDEYIFEVDQSMNEDLGFEIVNTELPEKLVDFAIKLRECLVKRDNELKTVHLDEKGINFLFEFCLEWWDGWSARMPYDLWLGQNIKAYKQGVYDGISILHEGKWYVVRIHPGMQIEIQQEDPR